MSLMSTTNEIELSPHPNPKEDVSELNLLGVARINIVNNKNLSSDTLNIKITCLESGSEYRKANTCKNINSKWNQVFYIPIYDIDKKLKIRVYDDIAFFKSVSLGSYIFNPKNFIEGKKLDLERDLIKPKNRSLRIPPRSNKKNLHFDADFYSFSNDEFTTKTTKFSKTIIFFYNLCNLIAYQSQDDSFKLDKLVNLFNFNSKDELIKTFTDTINDGEKVKTLSIDDNVLIAVLFKASLWNEKDYVPYMDHVMWKNYENYLEKIGTDIETKNRLYNLAKKFVIKHFKTNEPSWVSWVGEAIQSATIDVSQSTKTKTKSEVIKEFAEKFVEEFVGKLNELIKFQLKPENAKKIVSQEVEVTIGSNKTIEELKDEELVKVPSTPSNKIIVEQSVKKEKKDAVSTIQSSTTTKKAKEIISSQKKDGSFVLTDAVSKELDVASNESLVSSIKSYFNNNGVKVPENKKLIDTAITLSFLRKTSSTDTSPELKVKYEKAEKYLKTELGSDEKVKELLEKTDTVVVDHATKKVIKEKAEQTIVEKIQETITEEEIIEIIEIQNHEGSYEKISDKITEKLGIITTENISSSVRITDERVKRFDTKTWNTFITIAYCNKVLEKHKSKWTVQNEKARAWLHEQINDEKLENEILESCEKFVVEKLFKKKEKSALTDTAKSTEEVIYDALSCQGDDGSLQLSDIVSKELKFESTDLLISRVVCRLKFRKEGVPKNRELQHNEQLLHTAIILSFLKTTHIPPELKEKYEKAVKYLKNQLGSDENFKKVMETIGIIINNERIIKEAEEKGLVTEVH